MSERRESRDPVRRVFVVAALILFLTGCARQITPGSGETPQRVRVRKPNQIERPMFVSASGTVEAKDTAHVSFQVSGPVLRVHAEEGRAVRAGQLLAEIDSKDYELRVRAAMAQTAAARLNVAKVGTAVRPQELAQAKVDYERTADEYKRYQALYERKSLALNDYKKIEAAYLAARERLSLAQEGARSEDRSAAQEALRGALAQEEIAKKAVADTKLFAPIAGIIARRDVEPGEMAAAGRPVFVIMNLNPANVRAGVPEAEVGRIRAGQKAIVQMPSLGERTFEGRVETTGIAADPASRTYTVKLTVANPSLELRAGMITEARIQSDGKVKAMTVPPQAIVRDPQGVTFVYVYFPDKRRVFRRRVDAGTVYEREIEITRGLTGGESIVVAGQQLLSEGAMVVAEEAAQ